MGPEEWKCEYSCMETPRGSTAMRRSTGDHRALHVTPYCIGLATPCGRLWHVTRRQRGEGDAIYKYVTTMHAVLTMVLWDSVINCDSAKYKLRTVCRKLSRTSLVGMNRLGQKLHSKIKQCQI